MSFIADERDTRADRSEIKELTRRPFKDRLREFRRAFWIYTEENGESDTKPFEGWQ